jgi:capsular polysaccharide transport system permease protein
MLIVLGGLFGYSYQVNDLMMIYLSFFTLIIFSFSWGVMFMILAVLMPTTKKIIPMITKPLYFVSGIFFTVAEIPEGIRGYMLYNPILNIIEWIRTSIFVEMGGNVDGYYDLGYILSFTLISFFTAMLLYKKYKIRILTST